MKQYIKNNKIKSKNYIIVYKDGKQIINPTEEMILADGWVEYVTPEITIDDYKRNKILEIKNYDESPEVNRFYIQEIPVWLDKSTRVGLKLRFESELARGKKETTLWYNNYQFSLNLDDAVEMLYSIEEYASMCYDNTQLHLSNISKLDIIEEIENYDFRQGYPEKLYF